VPLVGVGRDGEGLAETVLVMDAELESVGVWVRAAVSVMPTDAEPPRVAVGDEVGLEYVEVPEAVRNDGVTDAADRDGVAVAVAEIVAAERELDADGLFDGVRLEGDTVHVPLPDGDRDPADGVADAVADTVTERLGDGVIEAEPVTPAVPLTKRLALLDGVKVAGLFERVPVAESVRERVGSREAEVVTEAVGDIETVVVVLGVPNVLEAETEALIDDVGVSDSVAVADGVTDAEAVAVLVRRAVAVGPTEAVKDAVDVFDGC
jgi:hypothetical protein